MEEGDNFPAASQEYSVNIALMATKNRTKNGLICFPQSFPASMVVAPPPPKKKKLDIEKP
jgi:hypothetical protein